MARDLPGKPDEVYLVEVKYKGSRHTALYGPYSKSGAKAIATKEKNYGLSTYARGREVTILRAPVGEFEVVEP